jgi:hypothetical protein
MRSSNWLYDGHNGDTDEGLFGSWGLGTQIITGKPGSDIIFPNTIMFGHDGDAYGLVSSTYTEAKSGFAFIFVTNGPKTKESFPPSNDTGFYVVQEQTFKVFEKYLLQKCQQ